MKQGHNQRIAKNTVALYFRMFFVLGLGLITSRYILEALGFEDYGIYNVVAGVVSLFSFISVSMNSASARFITTSIGIGDTKQIQETFKATCSVHIIIAGIIFILAETVGLWLVLKKLVIPENQLHAAVITYQISIIISVLSIIQTPFSAILISYERMGIYAGIEIVNVLLKFVVALLLSHLSANRLIMYMFFLLLIALIIFSLYLISWKTKFPHLHFGILYKKSIVAPMLSFSGWDLYGNMSVAARSQGVNILLNLFFGAILNAASGIAGQVQNAIMSLSSNVVMAVKPQIVKSYASGDIGRCLNLLVITSKFTTALLLLICVPVIMNIDYILSLWLKKVPQFTASFAIWYIIFSMIANLSIIIMSAIHATGKIKRSSILNGTLYLLVIPISYIGFKLHGSPVLPFIINAIAVTIGFSLNTHYLSLYVTAFKPKSFFRSAIIPILIIILITFSVAYYISLRVNDSLLRLIVISIVNTVIIILCSYAVLLTPVQRKTVTQFIKSYAK